MVTAKNRSSAASSCSLLFYLFYVTVVTAYPCSFLQPYRKLNWISCNKMENTSDENYNVIILSKTTNHSLSAVQHTRCAEKYRNSQSQSSLVRYSREKGKRGKGQSGSKQRAMQSGKAQISMRDSSRSSTMATSTWRPATATATDVQTTETWK